MYLRMGGGLRLVFSGYIDLFSTSLYTGKWKVVRAFEVSFQYVVVHYWKTASHLGSFRLRARLREPRVSSESSSFKYGLAAK